MFRRGKRVTIVLAVLASILALLIGGTGTAFAGSGPSVWEFGSTGDTCTGTPLPYSGANFGKQDCVYYESSATFQLGAPGITLEYKTSGGGNLIGWFDNRTLSPNYWFTSHTTSGSVYDYDFMLQKDCNIVIYQRGYSDAAHAVWAVGSQTSDPNNEDCRIRLLRNSSNQPYFVVEFYSSGTNSWWTQCAVPNGRGPGTTYPPTCNTGAR